MLHSTGKRCFSPSKRRRFGLISPVWLHCDLALWPRPLRHHVSGTKVASACAKKTPTKTAVCAHAVCRGDLPLERDRVQHTIRRGARRWIQLIVQLTINCYTRRTGAGPKDEAISKSPKPAFYRLASRGQQISE